MLHYKAQDQPTNVRLRAGWLEDCMHEQKYSSGVSKCLVNAHEHNEVGSNYSEQIS